MKATHLYTLSATLLAATLIQTGCSKSTAPAPTAAATPAPAAAPAAPAAPAKPAVDFGDATSSTLATKAWLALEAKDYDQAAVFAQKCIDLYQTQALDQEKAAKATPPADNDAKKLQWALNDVGTCYYQIGQANEKQKKTKEALAAYKYLSENLSHSYCWDPKGWFWSPAETAKGRIKALDVPN